MCIDLTDVYSVSVEGILRISGILINNINDNVIYIERIHNLKQKFKSLESLYIYS